MSAQRLAQVGMAGSASRWEPLRLSLSSALSELSSRAGTPIGLGEELEHSEELPSRAVW